MGRALEEEEEEEGKEEEEEGRVMQGWGVAKVHNKLLGYYHLAMNFNNNSKNK